MTHLGDIIYTLRCNMVLAANRDDKKDMAKEMIWKDAMEILNKLMSEDKKNEQSR